MLAHHSWQCSKGAKLGCKCGSPPCTPSMPQHRLHPSHLSCRRTSGDGASNSSDDPLLYMPVGTALNDLIALAEDLQSPRGGDAEGQTGQDARARRAHRRVVLKADSTLQLAAYLASKVCLEAEVQDLIQVHVVLAQVQVVPAGVKRCISIPASCAEGSGC